MTKVARYVTKSNHAVENNWSRDEKNGFKAGLHFLLATHPSAAQPLNLLNNGYRKDVAVPAPNEDRSSAAVEIFKFYVRDEAASQSMTFEQYLRTHNTRVPPPRKYQKIRAGAMVVATETTSPWRDHFYAQWLTLIHLRNGEISLPEARNLHHHIKFSLRRVSCLNQSSGQTMLPSHIGWQCSR